MSAKIRERMNGIRESNAVQRAGSLFEPITSGVNQDGTSVAVSAVEVRNAEGLVGCLVRSNSVVLAPNGAWSNAESLAFVPGVSIADLAASLNRG